MIPDAIFDVTADPVEIAKRLKTRQLCFVLNQSLRPSDIAKIIDRYYLMAVDVDGEIKKCVVCGLYKVAPADFEKIEPTTKTAVKWLQEPQSLILKEFIENPLCILISDLLTEVQISMTERVYEVIDVFHNNKKRKAIACAWYNPDLPIKGQVLDQEWRLNNGCKYL